MATAIQKGLSDAGAGAAAGSFAGPYGAVIGGVIGGLVGLFSGSDATPQSPMFSDINLQTDNPELYQQLQAQQAIVNQAQTLYNQRSQGMTPQEQQQYNQSQADLGSSMASRGLAGTNAAQAQSYGQAVQNQNNIAARTMQQQQQLFNQWSGAQGGLTNDYMQALQQAYNAKNNTYQAQLGIQGQGNQTQSSLLGMAPGLLQTGLQYSGGTGAFANNAGSSLPMNFSQSPTGMQYSGNYGGGYGNYGVNPAVMG